MCIYCDYVCVCVCVCVCGCIHKISERVRSSLLAHDLSSHFLVSLVNTVLRFVFLVILCLLSTVANVCNKIYKITTSLEMFSFSGFSLPE